MLVCEKAEKMWGGDDAPTTSNWQLPAGENVSREAVKPRGRSNAALYRWF